MKQEILAQLQALRSQRQRCHWLRALDGEAEALIWDEGSLGSAELIKQASAQPLPNRTGVMVLDKGDQVFCQFFEPQRRLIIIGAVHIAQTLAPLAIELGYSVRVIDPRPAFADPQRFAGIKLDAEWPEDCLSAADFDQATDLCLLSHDPKIDDPALIMALTAPGGHGYIGALGSRKTSGKRQARMLEAGISEESLSCLHSPIGLNTGSQTPAEIAVSITAELVTFKHASVV